MHLKRKFIAAEPPMCIPFIADDDVRLDVHYGFIQALITVIGVYH